MSGATELRFWGKIYGSSADYWIAEGKLNAQEEERETHDQEKRGEGINAQVYWVTDNLLEDWIQLPDIKPAQIQVARMIKCLFTGNLNADIDSNPPFPGKERHLLRAQIARITHATTLLPKGLMEFDEETNAEKFAEEFTIPGFEELKSLENWGHRHLQILKAGRITHAEPVGMSDEDKEAHMAALGESDAQVDRYRALNEDTPVFAGMEAGWTVKVLGDPQPYN